jgi:hypothetical protein
LKVKDVMTKTVYRITDAQTLNEIRASARLVLRVAAACSCDP